MPRRPLRRFMRSSKSFEHGSGGFAERNDKDALVGGEIDGCRAAAVGHKAMQNVALKAQAAVESGRDIACLERAGKDVSGSGVQGIQGPCR